MEEVLIKAVSFGGIIVLGNILKRVGFFRKEDFYILSKIMLNITLPASVILNLSRTEIDLQMLIYAVLGIGCGVVLILFGAMFGKEKGKKAFYILNMSGYNIGSFTMPFVQGFLGPLAVVTASLFDTGNSFVCLGGAYSAALFLRREDTKRRTFFDFIKPLIRSVPLMTYVGMTVLSFCQVRIPTGILSLVEPIAGANAFLAMLMIGVGMELSGEYAQVKEMVKILGIRYLIGIGLALIFYFLLPFGIEHRQALAILALSPMTSTASTYTGELKGDVGLAGTLNSLSIIISMLLITVTLMIIF